MSTVELNKTNLVNFSGINQKNNPENKRGSYYSGLNGNDVYFQGNNSQKANKENQKPSFWRKAAGFLAGSTLYGAVFYAGNRFITDPIGMLSAKTEETLSFKEVDKVAQTMIIEKELGKKGFSHFYVDKLNLGEIKEKILSGLSPIKCLKPIFEPYASVFAEMAEKGAGASYFSKTNMAIAGKKKPSDILHEIGHAINANSGKFINKLIIANRVLAKAAPGAVLLVGLFHTKKDDDKNKGFITKTADFIKDNAGKLALLSAVPMLFEEWLASAHGSRYARKVLGKTANLTGLKRTNAFALATYAAAAVIAAVAVKAGIYVRDKIVQPKQPR